MSSTRLVRGTKSRFFMYICAIFAFLLLGYVIHGSQTQLEESRKATSSCLQQQESLSAQLQVIFEYKLRLEKSLQKEKADHRETKEELQNKLHQEKQLREKEALEAVNKYNALEQHHKLLQSKNKDLNEECDKIRKDKLDGLEDKSKLEQLLQSVRQELEQVKAAKDKTLESMKSRYLELEKDNDRLTKENMELKKNKEPESIRIQSLEKRNYQLKRELEETKKLVESYRSIEEGRGVASKVSIGAPIDNPAGLEPPKFYQLTGNSTTPVINPEAVIEHDASSLKPQLAKGTKASAISNASSTKQATQVAAAPLQVPMNQENMGSDRQKHQGDINNELESLLPEINVIKKPAFEDKPESPQSIKHADKKGDDLNEENQGGEIGQEIPGPMNPIQSKMNYPQVPPFQRIPDHKILEAPGNRLFIPADRNANQRDVDKENHAFVGRKAMPDINGANEEGEDEVPLANNWRLDENKVIPRQVKPEYQGGDYDKPEEEDDEEGEQMDYLGGEAGLKHDKQIDKLNPLHQVVRT